MTRLSLTPIARERGTTNPMRLKGEAMTTTFAYKEASLEELAVRGAELRAGLSEISEGERSDENSKQMRDLLSEVDVLDAVFTLARHQDGLERARAAATQADEDRKNLPPSGALGIHGERAKRTLGERIMDAAGMKEWVDHGMRDGNINVPVAGFDLEGYIDPNYGTRAISEWDTTSGPGTPGSTAVNSLLPVGQPIAPIPRHARLSMRDLIPSQPTTLAQIPYVRELNPTGNELGASAVAEAATKPDASLSMVGEVAAPTVLAVSLSPSKQLWSDAPLVVAYINQRLPYLVKFKEDQEFIAGSGTWPNIQGIKNVPGIQTTTPVSGEYAQSIGMAIADIENVDGTASGCVLNPVDAWNMFTKRAAGGSGTFDAGIPYSMEMLNSLTVWGLPTVRSRAYVKGSALIGDFAHGAMILDREGVNIQIFTQHSTYALSNQILVLCEERVGLAVWRPDLFTTVQLS